MANKRQNKMKKKNALNQNKYGFRALVAFFTAAMATKLCSSKKNTKKKRKKQCAFPSWVMFQVQIKMLISCLKPSPETI